MVKSFNTWFTGLFSYGWFGGWGTSEPLERMGTSFGCRDFWDHLGGQVGISRDTGGGRGANKTKKVAVALPHPCRNYFINKQKADLFTD